MMMPEFACHEARADCLCLCAGVYRGSAGIEPAKAPWFYAAAREQAGGAEAPLNVVVHLVTKPSPGAQAAHMIASQKFCLLQVARCA